MFRLDRHLQCDGAVIDEEAFCVKDAAASDGEQTFRGGEGRLYKDLRHIPRLVDFFIRNQCDRFLFDLSGRGLLSAANPAGELALVMAAHRVCDFRGDLVSTTNRGLEAAGHRLRF